MVDRVKRREITSLESQKNSDKIEEPKEDRFEVQKKFCKWRTPRHKPTITETRFGNDPLKYFRDNYETKYKGVSRGALIKIDSALYNALKDRGQLEEAIPFVLRPRRKALEDKVEEEPKKSTGLFRGYSDPLAYYNDKPELHGLNRQELKKKDTYLYNQLLEREQLDEAIPTTRSRKKSVPENHLQRLDSIQRTREQITDLGDIRRVLSVYNSAGGNPTEASSLLSYPAETISFYWKEAGLTVNENPGKLVHEFYLEEKVNVYLRNLEKKRA